MAATVLQASGAVLQRSSVATVPRKQALFSTKVQSFFTYNSGRSLRRRRRLENRRRRMQQNRQNAAPGNPYEYEDTRTVKDILFPNPFKGQDPPIEQFKWPTSWAVWKEAFRMAWRDYRATWDGFFTSRGILVEDPEEAAKSKKERGEAIDKKRQEVTDNVKRNARFLQDEAFELRKQVRERTGIHSAEDLKRVAGDMMRLFSDCVSEFMAGYRKGRDEETEKMLTLYFQELEEKANEPVTKRRKPKRRIINRRYRR
jgi:hypothetical protein